MKYYNAELNLKNDREYQLSKTPQSIKIGSWLAALAGLSLALTNVGTPVIFAEGSNPPTLLMLRALFTVLVIGLLLKFTKRLGFLTIRNEIYCAISGLLFMFAGLGLLTAFAIAPVSHVVLVLYLFPLFATLFDAAARKKAPDLMTVMLMLLALAGLYVALDPGGGTLNYSGLALALVAALSAAATLVWNNHMLEDVDPEKITFRMFVVSLIVFGIYLGVRGGYSLPGSTYGNAILFGVLICFGIAFVSFFRGAQMAGSVRTGMIMNLEPVASIFLAVVFLSEKLNTTQYLGAGLVLLAVIIAQLRKKED